VAESVSLLALYGFDTLKVRSQLAAIGGSPAAAVAATSRSAGTATARRLPALLDLYRGVGGSLAATAAATAVFTVVYHAVEGAQPGAAAASGGAGNGGGALGDGHGGLAWGILAGAVATTVSSLAYGPFAVGRCVAQAGGVPVVSSAAAAAAAAAGRRGLAPAAARYAAGVRATLLCSLPFDALEFATFGALCRAAAGRRRAADADAGGGGSGGGGGGGGRPLGAPQLAALGMLTGALVGGVTAPLDVLAAASLVSAGGAPARGAAGGGVAGVRSLLAAGGVGGLFGGARGFGGKVAWEAANSGLFFVVYEGLMRVGGGGEVRAGAPGGGGGGAPVFFF